MPRKTAQAERKSARAVPVDPNDPRAAHDAGLRLLARREHSRRELTMKLAARRFTNAAIVCGLDSLEADGYLDEERFAEMLVRHRSDAGYGPLRIRAELASHAIEDARFESHLAAIPDAFWLEHARRIVARKLDSGSASISAETESGGQEQASITPEHRMRILQALAQRGFPAEIAHRALRVALESPESFSTTLDSTSAENPPI